MADLETLQAGDRVRIITAQEDLEEGSKGTVVAVDTEAAEVRMDVTREDWKLAANVIEKIEPIRRRASTGEIERTRRSYGVGFANTDTPEELLEIKTHLELMIAEGFSYKFMEDFLISYRYPPDKIRRVFTKLTNMTPQEAMNINYQYSPGSIPGFNWGWGHSKKQKGVYYFIMPIADWYNVLCQETDQVRTEVSRHRDYADSLAALGKLVKDVERWNPPVKEVKNQIFEMTQLSYRNPHLFMQATEYKGMYQFLSTIHSLPERKRYIQAARQSEQLTHPQYMSLMTIFADTEKTVENEAVIEKLREIESDEMKRPLQDELAEKTPQDFLDRQELPHRHPAVPADVIDAVTRYIFQAGTGVKDYQLVIKSFKYQALRPLGHQSDSDEPDLMNAVASVTVLLDVFDKHTSPPYNRKPAGMVFSVIGSEIWSTDTFKGDDKVIYGLSDQGLNKYFQKERNLAK